MKTAHFIRGGKVICPKCSSTEIQATMIMEIKVIYESSEKLWKPKHEPPNCLINGSSGTCLNCGEVGIDTNLFVTEQEAADENHQDQTG